MLIKAVSVLKILNDQLDSFSEAIYKFIRHNTEGQHCVISVLMVTLVNQDVSCGIPVVH